MGLVVPSIVYASASSSGLQDPNTTLAPRAGDIFLAAEYLFLYCGVFIPTAHFALPSHGGYDDLLGWMKTNYNIKSVGIQISLCFASFVVLALHFYPGFSRQHKRTL